MQGDNMQEDVIWKDVTSSGVSSLLGLIFTSGEISADKTVIMLHNGMFHVRLAAFGDCCSESWFEHVENFEALFGEEIRGVLLKAQEAITENVRQSVEYAEVIELTTDRGVCSLEFRNSSNGYYDGATEGGGRIMHGYIRVSQQLPRSSEREDSTL